MSMSVSLEGSHFRVANQHFGGELPKAAIGKLGF